MSDQTKPKKKPLAIKTKDGKIFAPLQDKWLVEKPE